MGLIYRTADNREVTRCDRCRKRRPLCRAVRVRSCHHQPKAKVEGIQRSTTETVTDIDRISKVIQDVNELVAASAAAMTEQAETAGSIAAGVGEASQGIGEITVKGALVSRMYFENPAADALAKIKEGNEIRHRMGDLGWMDEKGRLWFCGRKNHRVITAEKTLFTIPCEAIFNNHPRVFRSALVGVGPRLQQRPIIVVELEKTETGLSLRKLEKELLGMSAANKLTKSIQTVLFHKAFPVDIRHNSKIFREKLAFWAEKKI